MKTLCRDQHGLIDSVRVQLALIALAGGIALPHAGAQSRPAAEDAQAPARAESQPAGSPKIVLSQDLWNFGDVWRGEDPTTEITITNAGTADLELRKPLANCGCTVVELVDDKCLLKPGEVATLKLRFNTRKREDRTGTRVLVRSNDPERRSITVRVTGTVRSPIEVTPSTLWLLSLDGHEPPSATARIENKYTEPLKLTLPEEPPAGLSVHLDEVEAGEAYELTVRAKGALPKVQQRVPLVLRTNLELQPTLEIGVFEERTERVSPFPAALYVAEGSLEPSTQRIAVRYYGQDESFAVKSAVCSQANVTTEIREPSRVRAVKRTGPAPSAVWHVIVHLPAAKELPAAGGVKVEVLTTDPDYGTIVVPVTTDRGAYRRALLGDGAPDTRPASSESAGDERNRVMEQGTPSP